MSVSKPVLACILSVALLLGTSSSHAILDLTPRYEGGACAATFNIAFGASVVAFVAFMITGGITWSHSQDTQNCAFAPYCCTPSQGGNPTGCVILSPPTASCPSGQALYCNQTRLPQVVHPSWEAGLATASAVIVAVSGAFIALGTCCCLTGMNPQRINTNPSQSY